MGWFKCEINDSRIEELEETVKELRSRIERLEWVAPESIEKFLKENRFTKIKALSKCDLYWLKDKIRDNGYVLLEYYDPLYNKYTDEYCIDTADRWAHIDPLVSNVEYVGELEDYALAIKKKAAATEKKENKKKTKKEVKK